MWHTPDRCQCEWEANRSSAKPYALGGLPISNVEETLEAANRNECKTVVVQPCKPRINHQICMDNHPHKIHNPVTYPHKWNLRIVLGMHVRDQHVAMNACERPACSHECTRVGCLNSWCTKFDRPMCSNPIVQQDGHLKSEAISS